MFRTKRALSEKQPPTRAPQLPALKRANDQAMICFNDIQARPIKMLYNSIVDNTTVASCRTRMDYTEQQISSCYVRLTMCSRLHYSTGSMFMYQEPMCSTLRVCVSTISLHRNVFMQWRRDML